MICVKRMGKGPVLLKNRWTLALAVGACVFLSGCGLLPEEEEALPPPLVERQADISYELAAVTRGDIAEQIMISGVLTAAEQSAYYFDNEGLRLISLHVKAGDTVETGALVAQADPGDLAYRIAVQKNAVRIAQIRVDQSTRKEIEIRQIELDNEQLALDELEKKLERCSLYSDHAGVVLFADSLQAGEIIPAFRVLARIASPNELVAYAQSDSLKRVRTGMPVTLTIDGQTLAGKVTLSPDNTPDSADIRLKNAVLVAPEALPAGVEMGTRAEMVITLSERKNTLLVPQRAVRTALGQTYVQVLRDGVRQEHNVEVGIRTATQAEILSGLTEGMQVILK